LFVADGEAPHTDFDNYRLRVKVLCS
jgi:hypothetical protein